MNREIALSLVVLLLTGWLLTALGSRVPPLARPAEAASEAGYGGAGGAVCAGELGGGGGL